ncbi:DUF4089 domain-containing protein [Bordetella avium]|nr:DUF4089 domain-containing protein [Bordetella avium]WQE34444.1 DUF4089 domain-containing protein [Bordetella avium]SUV68051.1 Uncharacterised protein [Bordetella avium]
MDTIERYVRSALILQGYELPETAIQEVAAQFERIAAIAATFTGEALSAEPAPVFRA